MSSRWCIYALCGCAVCFAIADPQLFVPVDDSVPSERQDKTVRNHQVFKRGGRFADYSSDAAMSPETATVKSVATVSLHYPHDTLRSGFRIGRRSQRTPTPAGDQTRSPERYPSPDGKGTQWRFDLRHSIDADHAQMPRGGIGSPPTPHTAADVRHRAM
uniref:Uncharacterized protein n=1 Tax=Cryptomonas curvata TaxID=233186 RepID=A0A7S0M0E7_9CRYP